MQVESVELGSGMNTQQQVLKILDEVLCLNGRAVVMGRESQLLGAIPEFDSMAVVAVLTALEDCFGFTIADDDLDGMSFATVGTLTDFVIAKLKS